jgi:small subunit ribosomal protein S17
MPKRILQGVVVSDKNDKTIVVKVERRLRHPVLKKTVRVSKKYHAHDETNAAQLGQVVRIQEMRPLSKLKRWTLIGAEEGTDAVVREKPKAAAKPVAPKPVKTTAPKAAKPAAVKVEMAAAKVTVKAAEPSHRVATPVEGGHRVVEIEGDPNEGKDHILKTEHGTGHRVEETHRVAAPVAGGHRVEEIEGDPNEGRDHILKTVNADDLKKPKNEG